MFALRKYVFTISIRLSREEKARYDRLLKRFGSASGSSRKSRSEVFRSLLVRLDLPYETNWDNPGYDDLPGVETDSEQDSTVVVVE